jgi:hypothetical protein
MENLAISEFLMRYVIFPLITALTGLGWWMFKKQAKELDEVKSRTNQTEKDIVRIMQRADTEFQYMARDIKDIKQLVLKLVDDK